MSCLRLYSSFLLSCLSNFQWNCQILHVFPPFIVIIPKWTHRDSVVPSLLLLVLSRHHSWFSLHSCGGVSLSSDLRSHSCGVLRQGDLNIIHTLPPFICNKWCLLSHTT